MCTAATYLTGDFYFGRNLDYEFSYGDEVTITPRNYPFTLPQAASHELTAHYAIIGMAYVHGRRVRCTMTRSTKRVSCVAGLNFVGNAAYQPEPVTGKGQRGPVRADPLAAGPMRFTLTEARDAHQPA